MAFDDERLEVRPGAVKSSRVPGASGAHDHNITNIHKKLGTAFPVRLTTIRRYYCWKRLPLDRFAKTDFASHRFGAVHFAATLGTLLAVGARGCFRGRLSCHSRAHARQFLRNQFARPQSV